MPAPTTVLEPAIRAARHGVGSSPPRPDAPPKVTGQFAYASDLQHEGMLWGATLRSPHPHARIRAIDVSGALAVPGVRAVLTHDDVPGEKRYGMKIADQPVLAWDVVRYVGEPVALVAADGPELAREALTRIVVRYDVLEPLTDPEAALAPRAPVLHPGGNLVRHVRIQHGDATRARVAADVRVVGEYQTGMQDQAFLGPESGLAIPVPGGVELYVASQWLHDDRRQVAACLGLRPDDVRIVLAGVGGAFGGREDLSVQLHASLLALRTGRPVKMCYGRAESFVGHVHRHPGRIRIEHGATADGQIEYVTARLLLDGGAYTSTSPVVVANASYFAAGAYDVPNVQIDGFAVYTNNPPCGAMRGFGAVQACYAVESNMDKLAGALGIHPLELRRRNLLSEGAILPTGQVLDGPAPLGELLDELAALPLPAAPLGPTDGAGRWRPRPDPAVAVPLPGGTGNCTRGEGVRRGVGYALGMKAIGFSGGVDDSSTASVRLSVPPAGPVVEVRTSAAECGQGIVTVQAQIARTELGIEDVVVSPADTAAGDAGSSSASRQTWMTGGAVKGACEALRGRVLAAAARRLGLPVARLGLAGEHVLDLERAQPAICLADLLGDEVWQETYEFHHRPTRPIDPARGQGDAHVAFAYAAQRAVVDVDCELGLVRVVEVAVAEDVGKAVNPVAVAGQIEGGVAQGLGLALLEELQLAGGRILNASFTDYLIPTIADMPRVTIRLLELPHPDSPYGLNGVGELSALSSTPAIVNALRAATGLDLPRVPVRPEDIACPAGGRGRSAAGEEVMDGAARA